MILGLSAIKYEMLVVSSKAASTAAGDKVEGFHLNHAMCEAHRMLVLSSNKHRSIPTVS